MSMTLQNLLSINFEINCIGEIHNFFVLMLSEIRIISLHSSENLYDKLLKEFGFQNAQDLEITR